MLNFFTNLAQIIWQQLIKIWDSVIVFAIKGAVSLTIALMTPVQNITMMLLFLMILNIIVGTIKAFHTEGFKKHKAIKGITSMFFYFVTIMTSRLIEGIIGIPNLWLTNTVICILALTQATSIIQNLTEMKELPNGIVGIFKKIAKQLNSSDPTKNN